MGFDSIKHALRGDNHESLGTRIGLYIDPLHYISKLWGGQKGYDAFVNKSGDFLNKQASSVVKPIDKFARKYDPLHKAITSTQGGDEAATWIANKPATTAGIIYGGIAGAQGLGGMFGGGDAGAAPATSGGGTGFGSSAPANYVADMQGTTLGGNAAHAAAGGIIPGGAGMGSVPTAEGASAGGLGMQDYMKLAGQMGGGPGGGQDLGAQANAQVGVPPRRPTMSERFQGGMQKLGEGLNPIDPRIAASMDPNYLQQLRSQSMLNMGLGMMGAAHQGASFGGAANAGLGQGQAVFGKSVDDAYQTGKYQREQRRLDDRTAVADQRYADENAYQHGRDKISDEHYDQNYKENQRYHNAYLKSLDDRAQMKADGQGTLDPETIDVASSVVMVDPTRMRDYASYGASGQAIRTSINNHITQRLHSAGMNDSDLMRLRAQAHSNVKNLGQLQAQASQFSIAHDIAKANGDRLLTLFSKVDETGVPMIEGARRAAARGTGGVDETELKSVLTAFQTEVARILSGHPEMRGLISDSMRHEVEAMAPANMTTEQAKRVINRLYFEMDFKMQSIEQQLAKGIESQTLQGDPNTIDFGGQGGLGGTYPQIAPGQHGGPRTIEVNF